MNVENKVDKICRCCLGEEDNMKNMLLEVLVGPEKVNFIEAYRICAGLKDLDEDIAMYKQVCATCEYKLKVSYDFRELCQTSAKTLKERTQYPMTDVKMEALSDGEDEPIFLYNTFDQTTPTRQANHFNQVFLTDKSSKFKLPPPIVSQIKSEETKPTIRKEIPSVATTTIREQSPVVETKPKIQPKIEKQVEPPDGLRSEDDEDFDNNDECFAEPDIAMDEDVDDEEKEKKTKRRKSKDPDAALKIKRNRSKRHQTLDYEPDERLDVCTIEASYMCYYCDVFLNTHKDYLEHRENHKTENISNRLARQCFVCSKMVVGYIKHLEEVHREFRPNACKICHVKFQSQNALKNHLYIHCTANSFQCLGCNKKFKTQNQRRSHIIKEKHSSNKYHCPVCGLGTLEFITLHEHFTNEHLNAFSKQLFPCYQCKKVFSFNKHVLKHECTAPSNHWSTDPNVKMQLYKCDKCDQEFRDNDEMHCHKFTVCYARFSCTVRGCGLVFENAQKLSEHKRVHDQSVFVCDECGYSTTSEPKLLRHKTTHTTERAFTCPVPGCPATFKNKYSLYTHKSMHMERQYECHLCQKKFRFYTSIKDHMATHIESNDLRRYACDFCAQRFVRPRDRERHLRIHTDERPMKCSLCPRTYRDSGNLNEHFRRAHAGICYECKDCGKTYKCKTKLREHMFIHRGFKPFNCPACPHQFTKKYLFVKHLLVHNIKFDEKIHGYREMENFNELLTASLRVMNPNPEVAAVSGIGNESGPTAGHEHSTPPPVMSSQQLQQQQQQQLALQHQQQIQQLNEQHHSYFALPPSIQQQLQQGNGQRPY